MKRIVFAVVVCAVGSIALAGFPAAFPDAASVASNVTALSCAPAARFLAPGAIELPAPFSTYRQARAHWRFNFPVDMRRAKGIVFELYSEDFSQFSGFSIYFNT